MNFVRISSILLRQYYLIRDNPTRLVQIFSWILLEVILWGFISKYVSSVTEVNYTVLFLGAILLWEFMVRVMHGLTTAFFEDVWSWNFLNVFSSPISVSEYITGLVASTVITSIFALAAMLLIAVFAFGLNYGAYGLLLAPFILILFLSGIALGILGVAIVLRLGPAAEWFIWPIPAVLAPFAGAVYPISTLPQWMQWISYALPPSYVFEGMRAVIAGQGINMALLGWGTFLTILYIALAYAFFLSVFKHVLRSGLLARYSSETAS